MQDKYQQHSEKTLDDMKLKAFIKRSTNLPINRHCRKSQNTKTSCVFRSQEFENLQ